MDCQSKSLAFGATGAFSKIAIDYVEANAALRPFYQHSMDLEGIRESIRSRDQSPVDRELLVSVLKEQYRLVPDTGPSLANIEKLRAPNTYTITTAHQNNLFTGPLYFIYKILHVIRMAEELNSLLPGLSFVPVYYMGSEDADLEELNHINLNGEKLRWDAGQSGAVGRMQVNPSLSQLIDRLEGELSVWPAGKEIIDKLRSFFQEGRSLQEATFQLVHYLLGSYGVLVLIPDQTRLKQRMLPIFEDDLLHQTASGIVSETAGRLSKYYKVQASPRDINLFYLDEQVRERIERDGDSWVVKRIDKKFERADLLRELNENPERFSPNVILRGLYQETILPNIAFIGGGGELAYWLELKDLFEHYRVPMPVLFLRNSFLLTNPGQSALLKKLGLRAEDLLQPTDQLLTRMVRRDSDKQLSLHETIATVNKTYAELNEQVLPIDPSLRKHVDALKTKALYRLVQLEKKMLRAEKRKYADRLRQLEKLRTQFFPGNTLQERYENVLPYVARWGEEFIRQLYLHSPGLNPAFLILECGG